MRRTVSVWVADNVGVMTRKTLVPKGIRHQSLMLIEAIRMPYMRSATYVRAGTGCADFGVQTPYYRGPNSLIIGVKTLFRPTLAATQAETAPTCN